LVVTKYSFRRKQNNAPELRGQGRIDSAIMLSSRPISWRSRTRAAALDGLVNHYIAVAVRAARGTVTRVCFV